MDENKQRLLIVDDSRVIRVTARKILKDHFETVEAADGDEAWEILTGDEPVSLVVSDLTMPNLDGFGLLEKIRGSHLPHVREVPVIIITGANDTDATMEHARAAGATDFIGKPFDSVHLLARTQAHASSHQATNALRQEKTVLEDMSAVDQLTGLINESSFMELGYQQLSYAIRHTSKLCICRIEIDNFGDLYKQHGQGFTDSVTRSVGEILLAAIRAEDTAARTGAARFSLLLPGMDDYGIRNLAERINRELGRRTFKSGDTRLPVTLSIGVASPEIQRDTRFDEMLSSADRRLAQAIAMGGNRAIFEGAEAVPLAKIAEAPRVAAELETASVIGSVPETGITATPAFDPFSAGNLEIEEIELATPVFAHEPEDIFGELSSQNRTTPLRDSPAAPEPGSLAGHAPKAPAIEQPVNTSSNVTESITAKPVAGDVPLPIMPANDSCEVNDTQATAAAQAAENAISATFPVESAGDAANESSDSPATPEYSMAVRDDQEPLVLRRGPLTRLMSGLRALFRGSGRRS